MFVLHETAAIAKTPITKKLKFEDSIDVLVTFERYEATTLLSICLILLPIGLRWSRA